MQPIDKRLPSHLSQRFLKWWYTFTLPGFQGVPTYEVGSYIVREVRQQSIPQRAAAVSFSFMMATFPGIIFLFTLIAFIPIPGFRYTLLIELEKLLPKDSYPVIKSTIIDIIRHQRGGLLSFTLLASLWYSLRGVRALLNAFDKKNSSFKKRKPIKKVVVALQITVLLNMLVIVVLGLILAGKFEASKLVHTMHLAKHAVTIFNTINWIFIVSFFYIGISIIYFYGPATTQRWKFFNTGSIIAATIALLGSLGFSIFINNFGRYNKLYGSIGALIVIMVWINLNAWVMIIGFEINAAIDFAKKKKELGHRYEHL